MVEHLLAKEKVASSNLVFRSKSFQKNLDMNEFLNQLDDNLRQFLSLGSNALDASRDITKDINFAKSELKKDGSLLTKYDLLVEEKIFEILKDSNADIVTEEVLEKKENKDFCWYVDPIDGTTSFSRGIPLFGTIIGLTYKSTPIMGFIDLPKLNERYISVEKMGCFKNDELVKASECSNFNEAIISYGSPQRFAKENLIDQLRKIDDLAWDSRGYSDCFGYSLVFNGSIDLFIEADLNPWETIALENLSIESGASYAEIPSINGKKNIIFGSKNLINEATEIFGGDWKIK